MINFVRIVQNWKEEHVHNWMTNYWDPQKMVGTLIWQDMWVPGPRLKNPSANPATSTQIQLCHRCYYPSPPLNRYNNYHHSVLVRGYRSVLHR